MSVIYFLIALMPFDNHPFWGAEIIGTFTLVKAMGLLCFVAALVEVSSGRVKLHLLQTPQACFYVALLMIQCSSILLHLGELADPGNSYSHVFSTFALLITVPGLIYSQGLLFRSLLVGMGAIGFTSLYVIRGWQHYGGRPAGMFGDANEYALVVGLWLPLTFVWAFSKRPKWEKYLSFGCLAAALLGTTFAASRGGFLGFAVSFLFLIFRSDHKVRNLTLASVLIVPLLVFAPSSPVRRFLNPDYGDGRAEEARLVAWKAGLRMIKEHPIVGNGLGNFRSKMTSYQEPDENVVSMAHNTYVEITAELGIPGLIVYVGMLVSAIMSMGRSRQLAKHFGMADLANVALGLQVGLVSYVFSAFFMSAWWQKLLWLVIFLTLPVDTLIRRRVRQITYKSRIRTAESVDLWKESAKA